VLNFIKNNSNIKIPNEFKDKEDNTCRNAFLKKDSNFENMWIDYHHKHASLRILCEKCNLSRPKTKNKYEYK